MNDLEKEVVYIKGRIDQQIEGYAHNLGISPSVLTERLVQLLHPSRTWNQNRVSVLRTSSTQGTKRLGTTMEVAKRTPSNVRQEKAKKTSQPSKIKQYWMNMSPEQRRKEMDRRMKKRKPA